MTTTQPITDLERCAACNRTIDDDHDAGWHAAHCFENGANGTDRMALREAANRPIGIERGDVGGALTTTAPSDAPAYSIAHLYAGLVRAQAAVFGVAHDAENNFHRYRYTSSEAIIREARTALSAGGLAAFCLGWEPVGAPTTTESKNRRGDIKTSVEGVLRVYYRLVHSSGAFLDSRPVDVPWIAEPGKGSDKAQAAALTYALGYWLRGLLLIDRPDAESPVDQRDDSDYQPPQRRSPQPRPPQAAASKPSPPPKPRAELSPKKRASAEGLLKFWTANDDLLTDATERDVVENASLLVSGPDVGDEDWLQVYNDLGKLWKAHAEECQARKKAANRPPKGADGKRHYELDKDVTTDSEEDSTLKTLRDQVGLAYGHLFQADKKADADRIVARLGSGDALAAIFASTDGKALKESLAKLTALRVTPNDGQGDDPSGGYADSDIPFAFPEAAL